MKEGEHYTTEDLVSKAERFAEDRRRRAQTPLDRLRAIKEEQVIFTYLEYVTRPPEPDPGQRGKILPFRPRQKGQR